MGRPRAFDRDAALEQALQVFWTRGYDATSLDDLARATRLSRSSFYLAFGSKHDLFITSLERYVGQVGGALTACAAEPFPPVQLLDRLMVKVLALTGAGGRSRGCFLGNTSLELAGRDPAARQRVRAGFKAVEKIFAEVVRRGVTAGELPATLDPARAGSFMTSSVQGMLVMAKAGARPAELASLRKATLSALTQEALP